VLFATFANNAAAVSQFLRATGVGQGRNTAGK